MGPTRGLRISSGEWLGLESRVRFRIDTLVKVSTGPGVRYRGVARLSLV